MSESTLISKKFPPGGYIYREPEINWPPKGYQGFMMGREHVARDLQLARAQNPQSGLDPSYEACLAAIDRYTCKRLNNDPRWCGQPISVEAAKIDAATPRRGKKKCASCGRR